MMFCIFVHCEQPATFIATFYDPETEDRREWPLCKFHWNDSTIQHVIENKDDVNIRKVEQ